MNENATGTENSDELLGNKDETSTVPPEGEKQEAGSKSEAQEQGEKQTGFAKRMSRKVAEHEAELERIRLETEFWKREAMKATAPAAQSEAKTRLDFNSDDEWLEHRLQAERERLVKEAREQASEQTRLERLAEGYQAKIAEAKKELPDWEEVFAQAEGATLPHEAILFCLESPAGAKIAYHLAKNEEAYEAFIKLSPNRQAVELGRLEERLSKKPEVKQETVKKVSDAPGKLSDIKGGGSAPPTGVDRFSSKEAWRQWRQLPKSQR